MKRNIIRILLFVCLIAAALSGCISREKAMRQDAYQTVESGEVCVVSYYVDGTLARQETLEAGVCPWNVPDGDYIWVDENGSFVSPSDIPVMTNVSYYTWNAPSLIQEHVRFMPVEGDQFFPDQALTRGETAQILCALLDTSGVGDAAEGKSFTDVNDGGNVSESIKTVASMSVMTGYPDGTFRPDEEITRAEFAAILCRITGTPVSEDVGFADVEDGYWAGGALGAAREMGWMTGYDDGLAYPEAPVTRAEAVVMLNRVRGRTPNRMAIDLARENLPYVDVTPEHWAFYDIIDASFSNELMAYINGEVEGVEPGFIFIDGQMCHVNEETLRLDFYTAGFHTIDGGLYHVAQSGYFIQRYEEGFLEMDGSMFYVTKDDGPFLSDEYLGYLYFGENGRYTSGSSVVDEHVDRILEDILYDDSMTQEEKLYEAYLSIRDGGYSYMTRKTGWERGSDDWTLECARVMYESKRGVCYYWASAFLYLARRLGYQAQAVCGGVGTGNQLHAWVVIEFDGDDYIFDVELEWAYMWDFYQRGYSYMNMFKQPRSSPNAIYIFPGESAWYYGAGEENNEDDVIEVPEDAFPEEDGASGETDENTGDENTGGENTGGENTGGENTGGENTGGENTGGENTGGENTGGDNTGGESTGGESTGGENTGGESTGGDNTGGDNTGGDNTGGDNTGGDNTGGESTGGDNTGDVVVPIDPIVPIDPVVPIQPETGGEEAA